MPPTFTEEQIKAQAALTPEQNLAIERTRGNVAPITSQTIVPETRVDVPVAETPVAAPALAGAAGAISEQADASIKQSDLIRQQEADLRAAEQKQSQAEAEQANIFQRILGVPEKEAELREEADIAGLSQAQTDARKRVTTARNALTSEQRALTEQIRALEGSGLTDTQKRARVNELQRVSSLAQADMSLNLLAAQADLEGATLDLTTAQSIIDKKIELMKEPLVLQYNFLSQFLERNQGSLDKKEQRLFETKQAEIDREIKKIDEFENFKGNLQLGAAQQGASSAIISAIGGAKTKQEALQAAGEFSGDILSRRLKEQQLRTARVNELLARAEAGDTSAYDELGFNPNDVPLSSKELQNIVQTDVKLASDLDAITDLSNNKRAIELSSGIAKGGPLTAFFETGGGYFPSRVVKEDFLNEIKRLTGEYTLNNLIAKKAEGATFGALSNAELGIISSSASRLNSLLNIDPQTGEVTGITGSEKALEQALKDFRETTMQAIDLNNSRLLSKEDLQEIYNLP